MSNNFCPNINLPESKALIKKLGLLGFYKHYIENGYNISDDIEDNTSSVASLLFVNRDKFSAHQQAETIKSIIYQIQTLRKEGLSNAKEIVSRIKSDFEETEEYFRTIEEDTVAGTIADNIRNVIDHFPDFIKRANRELEKTGVKVDGATSFYEDTTINDENGEGGVNDAGEDTSTYDSTEAIFQKLNYDDESAFSQSSKDTASGDIKVALSLIPRYVYENGDLVIDEDGNPETYLNHLYLPQFEDLDMIWKDLLYTLVDVPVGEKMNYLKTSTNPRHQVIYNEIMSNPKTNIQNELEVVFSKQQANFVTVNLSKPDKGGNKSVKVFDTNRTNANSFLIDNWYEQFLQSSVITSNKEGERLVSTEVGKQFADEFKAAQALLKSTPDEAIASITGILNRLGLNISTKAFNETVKDENGSNITGAQVINSKLPYFFDRLSGVIKEQELEDSLEYNNPFINDTSSITLLAKLENKANPTVFEDSFISGDGKSKYSFVNNTYLSLKIKKLKSDTAYLQELQKTPYASKSYWLTNLISNPQFRNNFGVFYTDTLGNEKSNQVNKPFKRMSTKEKEFTRIGLFQNQGRGTSANDSNIGYFIGLTPSDKTTIPVFKTLKVDVKLDKNFRFNSETVEVMYDQIISEYNRVKQTNEQNLDESIQKIDGYHGPNGAGNKFVIFRFLNKALIENNVLKEVDDVRLYEIVRPELDNFLKELTEEQIAYWKSLDLYDETILDKSYKSKKGYNAANMEANLREFAANYAINQFVFMMNQTQLISGDPALHGKKSIDATWINFYKRMAKDIAPGLDGNFKNASFNTLFLEDLKYDSALLNEYNEKVGDIAQAYTGMNPADAQEYTTLQEHLDVMEAYGRLTAEGREAGARLLAGGSDPNDLGLILQPMKPVYVTDKIEDNIDKMYYIKTSSFPLIPALTSGLEIDKLRVAMEAKNIQRAVYRSGVKLGIQGKISEISKDGYVKFKELNITDDQIINLSRGGFRIQQELPYHGDHSHVSEGSQSRKLILNNVEDDAKLTYNGNEVTGKQAKEIFENLHIERMNRAFDKFTKDIGYDSFTGKITNLKAIEKILKEEAVLRNYPINDVYSIQVIKQDGVNRFKVPLGFTNNSSRFESILNALVTNRVLKQELPGFTKVQGSAAGFSKISGFDELNAVTKSGVVWVNGNEDTVLNYTRSENGQLTGADILVPSWFHGHDMRSYVREDGTLDTDRLPKDLLTLIGIRIPTQGYGSMMKFMVKGFLPGYMGDLAIVPSEIVVQMGSDFDVDKLFLYRYNYKVDKEGNFSRLPLDTSDISALSKEQIEDGIVQMFVDRLSDERMLEQMLEPNGFGKLPEVADKVASIQTGDKAIHTFTTKDQNNIHRLNNDGKAGTGVFSLFSTFIRTAQDAKIGLAYPMAFKNSKGQVVVIDNMHDINTIEGGRRSSTIAFFQSAAVDNSKEQILGKLNINDVTMPIAGTMGLLGLDEEFIGYFLSQPVIVDYVNRIQQADDIIKGEYDMSLEAKIYTEIVDKLIGDSSGFNEEQLKTLVESMNKISYGSKELLSYLENKGSNENSLLPVADLTAEEQTLIKNINQIFQYKVFMDFMTFKNHGTAIRTIQSSINVDTNGLGASYTALETKTAQITQLMVDIQMSSYPFTNIESVFTGNIVGAATKMLFKTKSIYANILPQGSVSYNQVIDHIVKGVGLPLSENNLNDIYRNIKSYVLTSPDIMPDLEIVRDSLLFGKNNIAKRWSDYSKTPEGKKNLLTSRIKPRFAKRDNEANTLTALNTPASNSAIDIDNSIMYFYDMLENGSEVEARLAADLVRYYIVTGAQFGPSSIGKYISFDVLEKARFSERLRKIEDDLSKGYILDGFIDQYFQNNPTRAKSFAFDDGSDYPSVYTTFEEPKLMIKGAGMATHFSVYNNKTFEFALYKKTGKGAEGLEYTKIPVLANTKTQIKSYNMGNVTPAPQSTERPTHVKEAMLVIEPNAPVTPASLIQDYDFNGGVAGVLSAIVRNSNNAYFTSTATDLLNNLPNMGTIKLVTSNTRNVNGSYNSNDNVVSLNLDMIIANGKDDIRAKFEEVVLHELLHAGTVRKLNRYADLRAEKTVPAIVADGDFTKEEVLAMNGIEKLFSSYRQAYPDQERLNKYIDLINKGVDKATEEEMDFLKQYKGELYPLANIREFVAAGLTHPEFSQELKKGNFFTKFLDLIADILGLNRNDLDALYSNTMSLIGGKKAKVKTNNIDFQEDQTPGYRERTVKNASADVTIALAVDFTSAGERLTKSSVQSQHKKYVPVDANNIEVTSERIEFLVKQINSINKQQDAFSDNGITLNIAGNGIYTMKGKYTQEQVDEFTYQLLKGVVESPNLKYTISSVRSGGQTGFDEAGIKAAERLGLKTIILAPQGWKFRNINGQDIANEAQFKARFDNIQTESPFVDDLSDDYNRLEFVKQRNEFLKAYKKQIGSVVSADTLAKIKKYADVNSKYRNLKVWGWQRPDGKLELRVSRVDDIHLDFTDSTAKPKNTQDLFIERFSMKLKDNLKKLVDRQRQLGEKAPADLSVRIDKLRKQLSELAEKQSVVATIAAAETKISEIESSLNSASFTPDDLYEFKSYINMLITLNQQIQFTEDFNDLTVRLNNVSAEAVKLNSKLRDREIQTVQSWLSDDVKLDFNLKNEVSRGLKDAGFAEANFLDFAQSSSDVIQSIGYAVEKAKFDANQKHDDFIKEFKPLLKDYLAKYKTFDMMLQKDKTGKPTGFLLNKYSQEFYTKSKGNFKFFNQNTTVDFKEGGKDQYIKDRQFALENLSDEDYATWIRLNSPATYMNEWNTGKRPESKLAEKYLSITPNDEWLDPNYSKLKALGENDPAFKFYSYIEPIIRKTNRKYNQQSNYIPEIHKTTLDYFAQGNMKGGLANMNRELIESLTVDLSHSNNEIDEFTGELRPSIPVAMFANNLSAEDKSFDLARIVEAVQYQEYALSAKREIEPLLNIYYNVIQDTKSIVTRPDGTEIVIDKAPEKILDQSNFLIQSYLYNKTKDVEGVSSKKIGDRNIATSAVTDSIINYVRIKGMALNPFSAIGNVMQGLTSNFITGAGGEYFTTSDNFKAFGTMLHSIGGKTETAEKILTMLNKFDVFTKANEMNFGSSREIKDTQNAMNNLSWFELQERGEYFIQGQTLLAMLYNKKVKVGDKEVSYFDAFDKNGNWKSEFGENPLKDPADLYKFTQEVKNALIDVHGNYTRGINAKKHFYTRAIMVFRTWIPQAVNVRFGSETKDLLTGKSKKGRYRSYNAFLKNEDGQIDFNAAKDNILWLLGGKHTTLTELDKINMRKNVAELALIGAISMMLLLLKAAIKDMDDDEKNATTYLINSLARSQSDLTFFMLPSSFQTITKDPIPLMTVLKDNIELVQAAIATLMGDPVYKSGPRKGKSRFYKELSDNFPIITQIDKNISYAGKVF